MMRPNTRQSPGANAAEKRHLKWVKERMVCVTDNSNQPVIAHHCEGSAFKTSKVLVGHWYVIGLCGDCDSCITTGSRRVFREKFGPQSELWLKQFEEYPHKDQCPDEVVNAIRAWGR